MSDQEKFDQEVAKSDSAVSAKDFNSETATEFEVSDGKARSEKQEKVEAAKKLESLLGVSHTNPYGTNDIGVFTEKLQDMNASDMQSLAMRVGLTPDNDKRVLAANLSRAFIDFVRRNNSAASSPNHIGDPTSPDYEKTVKLFGEGF